MVPKLQDQASICTYNWPTCSDSKAPQLGLLAPLQGKHGAAVASKSKQRLVLSLAGNALPSRLTPGCHKSWGLALSKFTSQCCSLVDFVQSTVNEHTIRKVIGAHSSHGLGRPVHASLLSMHERETLDFQLNQLKARLSKTGSMSALLFLFLWVWWSLGTKK